MHRMRKKGRLGVLALLTLALAAATATAGPDATREYVVVYEQGADAAAARAAVERAGGEIVDENTAVGVATVRPGPRTSPPRAARAGRAVRRRHERGDRPGAASSAREGRRRRGARGRASRASSQRRRASAKQVKGEPLADLQWDMQMIGATADGSYRREQGSTRRAGRHHRHRHRRRRTRTSRRTSTAR